MPPSGPATANVLGGVSEFHPLYQLSPIDLTATVRRPLFEPSRQPTGGAAPPLPQTVATPSAPAAVEADAAGYRLVGVIVSDERTTALLTVPGSTATLRLEAGDTLEGWKVAAIKLSHVTLERQGRRVELKMLRQAK